MIYDRKSIIQQINLMLDYAERGDVEVDLRIEANPSLGSDRFIIYGMCKHEMKHGGKATLVIPKGHHLTELIKDPA